MENEDLPQDPDDRCIKNAFHSGRESDDDLSEHFYPLRDLTEGDPILPMGSEVDPTPIRIDELVEEQAKDPYC